MAEYTPRHLRAFARCGGHKGSSSDAEPELNWAAGRIEALESAMQEFIDHHAKARHSQYHHPSLLPLYRDQGRREAGEVRSTYTYEKFKAILDTSDSKEHASGCLAIDVLGMPPRGPCTCDTPANGHGEDNDR